MEVGLVVRGKDGNGSYVSESVLPSSAFPIAVRNFQGHQDAGGDPLLGFARRHAVTESRVKWTPASDAITAPLEDEITIDVTVWIVMGPFSKVSWYAEEALILANAIFASERMGVKIRWKIKNATGNPKASAHYDFACTPGAPQALMKDISNIDTAAAGYKADRLHVYYVRTVDGLTWAGQTCGHGTDFCVLGWDASFDLLAHEICHTMGLQHVNAYVNGQNIVVGQFDDTNVMFSDSYGRFYLTEGQTYRAHFQAVSCLNDVYQARGGRPVYAIPANVGSGNFPPADLRLWPDTGGLK